jgi:hypothetical protein
MFSDRATVTPVKNFRRYSGKPNSNKYTVICLTVIGVCLVGLGIALIIAGKEYDVQDLIILGPIFLLAGVAFTILMFFIITRPFCEHKARKNKLRKKEKRVKEQKKKQDDTDNDTITKPTPYINDSKKQLKEAQNVHKRKNPPPKQLYGEASETGYLKTDVLPPGAVEVKDEPYVDYSDEDIAEMVKSTPPYDTLYGQTVRFNVSTPTSLEPNTNDSTGGVFNNNNALPPEECPETPVPSVVVYTQLNAE